MLSVVAKCRSTSCFGESSLATVSSPSPLSLHIRVGRAARFRSRGKGTHGPRKRGRSTENSHGAIRCDVPNHHEWSASVWVSNGSSTRGSRIESLVAQDSGSEGPKKVQRVRLGGGAFLADRFHYATGRSNNASQPASFRFVTDDPEDPVRHRKSTLEATHRIISRTKKERVCNVAPGLGR